MRTDIFNEDFQDFIRALNEQEVAYILVGAYSVILHGYARTTGDLDIWVHPTAENYQRLVKAFHQFGLPVFDMTLTKFLQTEDYDVFTFGRPPVCIEILTKVKGLTFETAYEKAEWFEIEENLSVRALRLADLIAAKKAAGRAKDLDDLEHLSK
jgi:predicted nucleotidyltransferase